MAIRNIVKEGDPILNKVCRPVTSFDDRLATLLDDMRETMIAADGVGLAGPQVGMMRRLFICRALVFLILMNIYMATPAATAAARPIQSSLLLRIAARAEVLSSLSMGTRSSGIFIWAKTVLAAVTVLE